jgi:hypothetical protein
MSSQNNTREISADVRRYDMLYRNKTHKSILVEAIQFSEDNIEECIRFIKDSIYPIGNILPNEGDYIVKSHMGAIFVLTKERFEEIFIVRGKKNGQK